MATGAYYLNKAADPLCMSNGSAMGMFTNGQTHRQNGPILHPPLADPGGNKHQSMLKSLKSMGFWHLMPQRVINYSIINIYEIPFGFEK